jgi:hypothetical protein
VAPKLEKGYHQIWEKPLGSMFHHLFINVLAFINNLGPNNKPKMLKVGPKFFQALTGKTSLSLEFFCEKENLCIN